MGTVLPNIEFLREHAADFRFLFNDAALLVNQASEPFQALVQHRIGEHKKREDQRRLAEKKAEEERAAREQALKQQETKLAPVAAVVPQASEQEEPDAWRENVAPVVHASEVLEPAQPVNEQNEVALIANHISMHCNIERETALLVAECITTTNVPFITFTRKAA